ncbi:MAG: inorganic phosphate transporter [Bacteroidales bacterium]|nr:inorganic phosphate transporter [Bacteroidales bacterium]
MEKYYMFIVGVLFILAVSDLVVGVSNDAVNFLNSAIGSKVASLKWILFIATLGIIVGATFSSGMMEVARKGIFNPGEFFFRDLMIIFLAVMLTDIILLDLFNTYGLPTSTTVSIVFELLGAAVGIAIIKLIGDPDGVHTLGTYINSSKALAIISGILLSIIIAFTAGAIIMYLTRLLFSFNFERNMKYFGSVWGGLAITAITYFMLIKGAKGASFMSESVMEWISTHTGIMLVYSFIGCTILLQLLTWAFSINIPKIIVLVGTFSLAMAFAGNDLINFIGVPLAGFESFKAWMASDVSPDALPMNALAAQIKTPTIFLLTAGLIMAVALWLSKKSRTVTQTEISLARQEEGTEMFKSLALARSIVRLSTQVGEGMSKLVPLRASQWFNKRFEVKAIKKHDKDADASFDLLRASINMVVASILIAFGTSLKLPLSTTYVTFMVAMGTSLADRAWGRESAVYRISGVMIVITGWFFTAMAAFTVSLLLALFINWAGLTGLLIIIALILLILFNSYGTHKNRLKKSNDVIEEVRATENEDTITDITRNMLIKKLLLVSTLYDKTIIAFLKEHLKDLRHLKKEIRQFDISAKLKKDNVHKFIRKLDDSRIEAAPYYVQIHDYLRESAHSLSYVFTPVIRHVDNNHKPLSPDQQKDMKVLSLELGEYLNFLIAILKSDNFENIRESFNKQATLIDSLDSVRKNQIKRIKKGETGTKATILYLDLLSETKNLVLQSGNILKSYRDFSKVMSRKTDIS